jgi:hypothetical protein
MQSQLAHGVVVPSASRCRREVGAQVASMTAASRGNAAVHKSRLALELPVGGFIVSRRQMELTRRGAHVRKSAKLEATSETFSKCIETKALERFGLFARGGDKRRRSWCCECRRAYNAKAVEQRLRTKAVRDAFAKRLEERRPRSQRARGADRHRPSRDEDHRARLRSLMMWTPISPHPAAESKRMRGCCWRAKRNLINIARTSSISRARGLHLLASLRLTRLQSLRRISRGRL